MDVTMTRPSFFAGLLLYTLFATIARVSGLKFDASEADWNLNTNRLATNPLEYSGSRQDGFNYTQSPTNWRMPFYTVFLDRFVNGDPSNDDINATVYETDMMSTQLRFGGDLEGLKDSLDYIAGMGIKVRRSARRESGAISLVLTPDRPSTSQGLRSSTSRGVPIPTLYVDSPPRLAVPNANWHTQPIDLTLLDKHYGTVKVWQEVIDEVHRRGMWVILDNTMGT